MSLKNNRIYIYFLDYLKGSSRLEAKYRILIAGKYHNVGVFKYWLWGPFHNGYHARPFDRKFSKITSTIFLRVVQLLLVELL